MNRANRHLSTLLFCVCTAACTAGPERADRLDHNTPTVDIHARVVDPPAGGVDGIRMWAYWADHGSNTVVDFAAGVGYAPSIEDELRFRLEVVVLFTEARPADSLRFFRLVAVLYSPSDSGVPTSGPPYPGSWEEPGVLLVYAMQSQSWSPFGPGGPSVTIPQGYSLLRRSCGPLAGQLQMEVRPVDEVIQLRHQDGGDPAYSNSGRAFEAAERALVESCGATVPVVDVGTRACFDVAKELVWSRDDSTLYYLSPADPDDRTKTVGLRQVRLADSSASELTTVPHGESLQLGKAGEVFLATEDALLRFTLAPTLSVVSMPMPPPVNALVSPDGRWLGYTTRNNGLAHVMDLDTGANVADFDSDFSDWSPDGRFAYWSMGSDTPTLNIASLAAPKVALQTYSGLPWDVANRTWGLTWTAAGATLLRIPTDWNNSDNNKECLGCFGLTVFDPSTATERTILDASAGRISHVRTTPALHRRLVWDEQCLGLWGTLCSYSLLSVDAVQGTVQTVATSSALVPLALSSDGRRVAFGTSKGVYVKALPQ